MNTIEVWVKRRAYSLLTNEEVKLCKKYSRKEAILSILLAALLLFSGFIYVVVYRSLWIIVLSFIVTIVLGIMIDDCAVERHRIKTHYYHTGIGVQCPKCGAENKFSVEHAQKLVQEFSGEIPVSNCVVCGGELKLYPVRNYLRDCESHLAAVSGIK